MKNRTSPSLLVLLLGGLVYAQIEAVNCSAETIYINSFVFQTAAPGEDTTPPTLVSAEVDESGLVFILTFSEIVTCPNWTFNVNELTRTGGSYSLIITSGDGTNTVTFEIGHGPVLGGEELTVEIGNGIFDLSSNTFEALSNFSVTNNSEQ